VRATIDTAVARKVVKPAGLERVNGRTMVQEKVHAHPVESRLLEIARQKVISAAKRAGVQLKQTFAKAGKEMRRRASGYAHARQFRRLTKVRKRQYAAVGVVLREVLASSRRRGSRPSMPRR